MEAIITLITGPALCLFVVAGLIVIDILLGIVKAVYKGTFNSTEMRKGGWRKLAEIGSLIAVFGLFAVAPYLPVEMAAIGTVGSMGYYGLALFWSFMEIRSLFENVSEITGVRVDKLTAAAKVPEEEQDGQDRSQD